MVLSLSVSQKEFPSNQDASLKMEKPRGRGMALLRSLEAKKSAIRPELETNETIKPQEVAKKVETLTTEVQKVSVSTAAAEIPKKAKGVSGRPIDLKSNAVALSKLPNRNIWLYSITFHKEVDSYVGRMEILNQHPDIEPNLRFFNGNKLIVPRELKTLEISVNFERMATLTLVKRIEPDDQECLYVYNMILTKSFACMGMARMNMQGTRTKERCFFNPKAKTSMKKHKLDVWPGYITRIASLESGPCLVFDSQSKVVRQQTVADVMKDLRKKDPETFKSSALKALLGQSVITRYNNKMYRVKEITFEKSPESTFMNKSGIEITLSHFYETQYGIKIADKKQPLLVTNVSRNETIIEILLVPELCLLAGLTKAQKEDFRFMREMKDVTSINPQKRLDNFQLFLKQLQENKDAMKLWSDWGLAIASKSLDVKGRVLPAPHLHFGKNFKEVPRGEWGKSAVNRQPLTPMDVEKWAIIFNQNVSEQAFNSLKQGLQDSAKNLGMAIKPPKVFRISDDKTETFLKTIREIPEGCELVVTIFGGPRREDRYSAVKKLCYIQRPMASQVVMSSTLMKEKTVKSVCAKLLLQMTCKKGGELWGIKVPIPLLCVIGIEDSKEYRAVVTSLNETFSRFYSDVANKNKQEKTVKDILKTAFEEFKQLNQGKLPLKVLIYANSRFAMEENLKGFIQEDFPDVQDIVLIIVEKRNMMKLMHDTSNEIVNPPAGTVLDHTIVTKNNFYLVPMNVNFGTVSPTHYIVTDPASFELESLQQISYALCHMYFNWTGTVKVPAPCLYAYKLCDMVESYLKKAPSEKLCRSLFYL